MKIPSHLMSLSVKGYSRVLIATVFGVLALLALAAVGFVTDRSASALSTAQASCPAWTVVQSANAGPSHNVLYAVSAISPQEIWAAGYYQDGETRKTLVLRWNGREWNVVPSPNI